MTPDPEQRELLRVHPSAPDWSIHGPDEWAAREYERKISGWHERQQPRAGLLAKIRTWVRRGIGGIRDW